MKRKIIAVILAGTLALGGAAALAADGSVQGTAAPEPGDVSVPEQAEPAPEAGEPAEASAQAEGEPAPEAAPAAEPPVPDQVGTVSFANLESRLRENNFTMLSLSENIAAIESLDYEKMTDDMRNSINGIAKAQWMLTTFGQSFSANALQSSYDSLKDAFEDLRDGKIQEDNQAVIRQLKNAQDQMVMAAESLYVALTEMGNSDASLGRQLAALDRTLTELDLRYDLGQVSALTVEEARGGRTALVSGRDTLRMNITNCKLQLEQMIGAELTGEIRLQALPQVSGDELAAMDMEADLACAKEASYSLFAAQRTLDDARDDYIDGIQGVAGNSYQRAQAEHLWQAAQYTYSSAVQSFENSFRTLYNQVKDYQQVLTASRTALAVERDSCAAAQLKYDQGNLSQNKLLDAQDEVTQAQEKVDAAALDLFSAWNSYRWAVDYGILN